MPHGWSMPMYVTSAGCGIREGIQSGSPDQPGRTNRPRVLRDACGRRMAYQCPGCGELCGDRTGAADTARIHKHCRDLRRQAGVLQRFRRAQPAEYLREVEVLRRGIRAEKAAGAL